MTERKCRSALPEILQQMAKRRKGFVFSGIDRVLEGEIKSKLLCEIEVLIVLYELVFEELGC